MLQQYRFNGLFAGAVHGVPQPFPHLNFKRRDQAIRFRFALGLGGDAHVGLTRMGCQADGGVAAGQQVAQRRVDAAFAHAGGAQHAGLDDRVQVKLSPQVGQHRLFQQVFHFMGHPRQADDHALRRLDDETGGGAHRVFEGDGVARHVSLAAVVLAHRGPPALKAGRDLV